MARSLGYVVVFCIAVLWVPGAAAQPIFPGLHGEALREALRRDHAPTGVLGYGRARDSLFLRVDLEAGDSLRGVYTGFAVHLDTGRDPTTDAFQKGLNTEHTWPQSMGAGSEPMKSDMHHLFPAKDNVNSARGNHPYDEIPDAQADAWYYADRSRSTPPTTGIDRWSEKDNETPRPGFTGRFEPREDHKGNAARAMFYFRTMYPEAADRAFFDAQKTVLRAWNALDPVDAREKQRTEAIARHQGNVNPFVLDSTLVRRAFFEGEAPEEPAAGGTGRYTFDGNNACPTTDDQASGPPERVAFSEFFRVGVACTATQGVFNSEGWPQTAGRENGRYVGFAITPAIDAAVLFSGARLHFTARRSGTGPPQGALLYRIGSTGDFTTLFEWMLADTNPETFAVNVPDAQTSQVVQFNFYGWGATDPRGTLRFDDVRLDVQGIATSAESEAGVPAAFRLLAAYPNPFNPRTTIPFELRAPAHAQVAVFDVLGRRVAVLADRPFAAGTHRLAWDAGDAPSGLYFVQLNVAGAVRTRHVMRAK